MRAPTVRRPWSLRRRLVASITGVIAAILLTVGIASVVTLSLSVTSVVDTQLAGSMDALRHSVHKYTEGSKDGTRPAATDPGRAENQPTTPTGFKKPMVDFVGHGHGTVIALLRDGVVIDSALFTDSDAVVLPEQVQAQLEQAVHPGDAPETISLAGLGNYRMTAELDDEGRVIVAAVPLATAEQAVVQQSIMITVLSILALLVTVGAIVAVVRLTLRPLDRVVGAAAEVVGMPLDKGDASIVTRLADADTDPRTELGKVGQALNQLLSHMDEALAVRVATDKRMRRFVTDASHELRTPLAAIQGYAELTRHSSDDLPEVTEYSLARIEAESRRMSSLVSDLLLLARLDEGQDLQRDEVDLSELVINAVSDARASAPEHSWTYDVPDDELYVLGDHERLHQLIVNLLSNAAVHTPSGSNVSVSLRSAGTPDAPMAQIAIGDDGPGIAPELIPGLFDRFSRGDESRSRAAGSTGLGLAIALSIVEAHEGSITVDSSPAGTTFTVLVPQHFPANPSRQDGATQNSIEGSSLTDKVSTAV